MGLEINSFSDENTNAYAFWALKTGLWDGRPVTWKEAPEYFRDIETRLKQLLLSQGSDSISFEKIAAPFAWIGSRGQAQLALAQEIEWLRVNSDGAIVTVRHHKHDQKNHESFWQRHKIAIIVGLAALAIVTTVVVVTVCTGGTGGQAAASLGGAAINGLQNSLEKGAQEKRISSEDKSPPILPQAEPTAPELRSDTTTLTDSLVIDSQIPIQSDFSPQSISDEFQQPESPPPFDQNWTPPISSFNPYRLPENSSPISAPPVLEPKEEKTGLTKNLQDVCSALVHQTVEGIHDLGYVVPKLIEEIRDLGDRIIPNSPLSRGEEITPVENYDNLFAGIHEKVDQLFSTVQADLYSEVGKKAREWLDIGILPPPGNITRTFDISKIRDLVKSPRETLLLAEKLDFSHTDISHFRELGNLEATVVNTFENVVVDRAMYESLVKHRNAQIFLKPYSGFMSETQCRELIHQTGIRTFARPEGIPENFRVKLSNRGAGMKYVHPENEQTCIRVMPGKPHSPWPYQQHPYVIQMKDGKAFDKFGNFGLNPDDPLAHIPLEEFIFKN